MYPGTIRTSMLMTAFCIWWCASHEQKGRELFTQSIALSFTLSSSKKQTNKHTKNPNKQKTNNKTLQSISTTWIDYTSASYLHWPHLTRSCPFIYFRRLMAVFLKIILKVVFVKSSTVLPRTKLNKIHHRKSFKSTHTCTSTTPQLSCRVHVCGVAMAEVQNTFLVQRLVAH